MIPNPFKTIWLHPRDTVRRIVAEDPGLYVIALACFAGISETLNRASGRNAADKMSLTAILLTVCIGGPCGGILTLWITGHLIRWTGGWLGGSGNRKQLETAIAWAAVPMISALPLWIPALLLYGRELFTEDMPSLDAHPALWVPLGVLFLAQLTLTGWTAVLLCQTTAEIQGFRSGWRALANILLAALTVYVPLLLLVIILSQFVKI